LGSRWGDIAALRLPFGQPVGLAISAALRFLSPGKSGGHWLSVTGNKK